MNKIIIGLIVLLSLLIMGIFGTQAMISQSDLYKNAEHIDASEVLEQDGDNIYYFYQETCSHCTAMKPSMTEFYDVIKDTDTNFYLVDMTTDANAAYWSTDSSEAPMVEDIKSNDDLQIIGTPTMVTTKDKEVTNYGVGGTEIFDILDQYISEYDLDLELDRSEY